MLLIVIPPYVPAPTGLYGMPLKCSGTHQRTAQMQEVQLERRSARLL